MNVEYMKKKLQFEFDLDVDNKIINDVIYSIIQQDNINKWMNKLNKLQDFIKNNK